MEGRQQICQGTFVFLGNEGLPKLARSSLGGPDNMDLFRRSYEDRLFLEIR